jgi:hypothetical protein
MRTDNGFSGCHPQVPIPYPAVPPLVGDSCQPSRVNARRQLMTSRARLSVFDLNSGSLQSRLTVTYLLYFGFSPFVEHLIMSRDPLLISYAPSTPL